MSRRWSTVRIERQSLAVRMRPCIQADDTKEDDPMELEDVGNAQREAEDDAEYTGPEQTPQISYRSFIGSCSRPTYHCPYIPAQQAISTCPSPHLYSVPAY